MLINRHTKMYRVTIVGAVVYTLSGCSFLMEPSDADQDIDAVEERTKEVEHERDAQNQERDPVEVRDDAYISSGRTMALPDRQDLPAVFDRTFTLVSAPMTLSAIAEEITRETGVEVDVQPDLREPGSATLADPVEMIEQSASGSGDEGGEGGGDDEKPIAERRVPVDWDGPLKDYLDALAAQYHITWDYNEAAGRVELSRFQTETYTLAVAGDPGSTSSTVDLNASTDEEGEGSGGASAGSEITSEREFETDLWEEMQNSINSILTSDGSVTIDRTTGSLTVRDQPATLTEVEEFVRETNRRLSRQVAVEMSVYSLTMSETDSQNFSFDLIYSELGEDFDIRTLGANPVGGAADDAGSLAASILTGGSTRQSEEFGGSEALFDVLREYGDAALEAELSGVTLSGRALPLQDTLTETYIAETQTTVTGGEDGTTQTDLQTDEINTGLSARVQPRVTDNNRVMLNYAVSLSALEELRVIEQNDTVVEAPRTRARSAVSNVAMPTGSTLVLAGIDQDDQEDTDRGSITSRGDVKEVERSYMIVTLDVNRIDGANVDGVRNIDEY